MKCCRESCGRTGLLHLTAGIGPRETYTGGSFCSWRHLADWLAATAHVDQLGITWEPPGHGR